jgi:hypothetical protein
VGFVYFVPEIYTVYYKHMSAYCESVNSPEWTRFIVAVSLLGMTVSGSIGVIFSFTLKVAKYTDDNGIRKIIRFIVLGKNAR